MAKRRRIEEAKNQTDKDLEGAIEPELVAAARLSLPSIGEAEQLEFLLNLIADRVRFRILSALAAVDELCVRDIAIALETSEDSVSYALRLLRTVGMVQNRRNGRTIYYKLADGFPRMLLEHCLHQLVRLSGDDDHLE